MVGWIASKLGFPFFRQNVRPTDAVYETTPLLDPVERRTERWLCLWQAVVAEPELASELRSCRLSGAECWSGPPVVVLWGGIKPTHHVIPGSSLGAFGLLSWAYLFMWVCMSWCARGFLYWQVFFFNWSIVNLPGFPGGSVGKESAYNARYPGSIPGAGRSPGERNKRGVWRAIVHRVWKSWTRLKQLSMHAYIVNLQCCVNFCCTAKWFSVYTHTHTHTHTYIYAFFSIFFSIMVCLRILNRVPCAIR